MTARGARGKAIGLARYRASAAGRSRYAPKLTPTEQQVFDQLRADGWDVYRNGWPDFLAERNGEVRFIEVKSGEQTLSTVQRRVHKMLRSLGLTVETINVTPTDPPD